MALSLERAAAVGLRWPLPTTRTDRVLEVMVYAGHWQPAWRTAQNRARLDLHPPKAAPPWRHLDAVTMADGTTVLGNVEIKKSALVVSINSAARGERATAMLRAALDELVAAPLIRISHAG